jgi:hypothetical protein
MILLLRDEKNTDEHDLHKLAQGEEAERMHRDTICPCRSSVTPFIFLFAFYVHFYGEISQGGGFSGGTVLGGDCSVSSPSAMTKIHSFFHKRTFDR